MTTIRLTNTLTRRKEVFEPIDPRNVRMYVCGPTVYDRAHLGNARAVVAFDVLYRLLRHVYGEAHVTYARNFTDVDDKINARAAETGRPIREITDETIRWFHEDMDALGALRPTHEPRATEWIGAMVGMIEGLVANGHAYAAEGHVLFRVRSYAEYGALSGRSVDDMMAGARVEVAPWKDDPLDFVLWKPSGADLPGWDSPWGRGRPGWHIECSAMARELLGGTFDIHGGGLDLQFPHHENEIAQSRCAHPHEGFARVWMHNEMLLVDGRKMAKSAGNFLTVRDLLAEGEFGTVVRFVLLGTHYSKALDWTDQRLIEATIKLRTWAGAIRSHISLEEVTPDKVSDGVIAALANDLDTHGALKYVEDYLKGPADEFDGWLQVAHDLAFLGLLEPRSVANTTFWVEREAGLSIDDQGRIADLLAQRDAAKKLKDFATADRLRDVLVGSGLILMDGQEPPWKLGPRFDASKL